MKVPEPRKLPSGSWHCKLQLGGECISITRRTKEECKAEARCIKADYLAGKRDRKYRKEEEKTLSEIQTEFLNANRPVLSPSTVRSYDAYIRHRWKDYRDMRIKDINFQSMINTELSTCKPKTVRNGWGLVSASLKHAGIPVPSVKLAAVPENNLSFLQPDEILKFCDTIRGRPFEIAALLMLHGLRLSEVLAMQWKNIDIDRGMITVHGAVVRGPDGNTLKQTNKNRTSTRMLPIMIPRLSELVQAGQAEADPEDLIVKTHPSNLLEDVKRACRDAGITETTCHGLRRSYASLLYRTPGVSEKQVMLWGGWSNIQTMHRVYIQIAAADDKAAAKAVQEFYLKEKKPIRKQIRKRNSKNAVK